MVDQAGCVYSPEDTNHPANITGGNVIVEMPADVRDWCSTVEGTENGGILSECGNASTAPAVLNESTGYPIQGVSEYPNTTSVSVPMDFSFLEDGNHTSSLQMTDWAGNSHSVSWNLTLDRTPPLLFWALSPSTGELLQEHRQKLSWWSSEDVHVIAYVDGGELPEAVGSNGSYEFELNATGPHELCLQAVDSTRLQENSNRFLECRTLLLPESTYDTGVVDSSGILVSLDSIEIVINRHETQEIRWSRSGSDDFHIIEPGNSSVTLVLDLIEGQNDFTIEVDSLNSTDSYAISLERDSIPPVLDFHEDGYREAPLNSYRQFSGACEPGLLVNLQSPSSSRDFICPSSGQFTVNLSVPTHPGMHLVQGSSTDATKNTQTHSIEVLKQDWSDWALEDATSSGPMLWWSLAGGMATLAALGVAAARVLRPGPEVEG